MNTANTADNSGQRKKSFIILIMLNIIAGIIFAISFQNYVQNINDHQLDESISSVEDTTTILVDSFGSYLMNQETITSVYAKYIEKEEMNLDEAARYLETWKEFYSAIAIVNVDTKKSVCLASGQTQPYIYDFGYYSWVRKICNNYIILDNLSHLKVSEVFNDFEDDKNNIAFYAPVKIEEKPYILMFITDTESIQSNGMTIQGMDTRNGLLLDKNGNVLIGELNGMSDAYGINYYDFFDSMGGARKSKSIRDELKNNGEFTFDVLHPGTKERYVSIAKTVPYTNGWVYI